MRAYVSGALTGAANVAELKQFYEAIAAICAKLGIDAYVPHLHSDPILHAHIPAEQVFEIDKHQVRTANLVIAYIGAASLGVGAELVIASYEHVPIILLYEQDRPISRMALGTPGVIKHIPFTSHAQALSELELFLQEFLARQ